MGYCNTCDEPIEGLDHDCPVRLERMVNDLDRHIRGLVINLKARGKTAYDLMDLIGCGSTVAHGIWRKFGEWQ